MDEKKTFSVVLTRGMVNAVDEFARAVYGSLDARRSRSAAVRTLLQRALADTHRLEAIK